jgi:hypothetical protein
MAVLSGMYTYPIKSCAALRHESAALDSFGLPYDRRWMIINPDGMFQTQRELPALALIQPAVEADALTLSAPGLPTMRAPLHYAGQVSRQVEVWGDVCEAWDEGDALAEWLSDYLGTATRLVRMTDDFVRPVDPDYAPQPARTAFSDGFPLLLVSEASLDDLNSRLIERGKQPIPMSRFRPNLVVSESMAYAEDDWKTLTISGVTLDVVKPCARCATTTVDQATGTVPDHAEPLATLNTYRKINGKVYFAQNVIHRTLGTLRVGDRVHVGE